MTTINEKVFPRGGRNPALANKPVKTPSFSLFNKGGSKVKKKLKKKKDVKNHDKKKRKSTKFKNQIEEEYSTKELKVKYVDDLNSNGLHEGMLVLGIVSNVTEKIVHISLPGGLRGVVTITNVSQFYRDLIVNAKLNAHWITSNPCANAQKLMDSCGSNEALRQVSGLMDLFKIGEILPTRVLSRFEDSKLKFLLTLDPKSINSKVNELEEGMILVGSVKSEEDHGYLIDFGIQSVNGFLHFQKVEKNQKLPIGKLIRCIVTKCTNSSAELSLLQDDMRKGCLSADSSCPIHSFIPGFQFKVTVTKVLRNGVEVTYKEDENFKGFIYEDHLSQLFPKLNKIEVGTRYTGTILYIKPLVNTPHFKVMSYKPQNWIFQFGEIRKGKVVKSSRSGVMFRIGKKLLPAKCFVPLNKLSDCGKVIEHDLDVDTVYPVGRTVEKIRLMGIDYMRRCYIGTTDKRDLDEKYFSVSDLKCGDIVPCKIESIETTIAHISVGRVSGIVSLADMTDIPMRNPTSKFKVGQKATGRVVDINQKTHSIRLTMKPSLLKKKLKTLSDYNDAKLGERYTGTLIAVNDDALIVRFLNGVVGKILKIFTPHSQENSLKGHYTAGQLVKCYVVRVQGTNLQLSLTPQNECSLETGTRCDVVVTGIESYGLLVRVKTDRKDEPITGMIPTELLSSYPGLGEAMLPTFNVNQKLTAYYVCQESKSLPVFAICSSITSFYDELAKEGVECDALVRRGQVYPFLYSHTKRETGFIMLCPVIPSGNHRFKARQDDLPSGIQLRKYQVVYGAIESTIGRHLNVSLKLDSVWNRSYQTSIALLDLYLDGMKRIIQHDREKDEDYLSNIKLGSIVSIDVADSGEVVHEVEKATAGNGRITGKVVWIRGDKKLLCVNTKSTTDYGEQVPDDEFELSGVTCRAEIVYIGDEVVVASLKGKGKGKLICLPRKRHQNDFQNPICPYVIGGETRVWLERGKLNNIVGIDREVKLLEGKKVWKSCMDELGKAWKRKMPMEKGEEKMRRLENGDDMEIIAEKYSGKTEVKVKEESDDDIQCDYVGGVSMPREEIKQEEESDEFMDVSTISDVMETSRVEIKSEDETEDEKENEKDKNIYSKERILLSSSSDSESEEESDPRQQNGTSLNVGFDWSVLKNRELLSGATSKPDEDSSSSEDEEESKNAKKKKRVRLSKSELEEKAREEEERLRLVEERLIRTDLEPETADDFDRALLAKPNSSELWVKYMAFHLQATEIEKARAVARRALKTISFSEEREKLNVWVALLNLENLYGNEESLNKTLNEAVMCNEPYHVHLHMMNLHGQSGKYQEMERIGNMLMKKFKDVENVWEDVGLAYFKVEKLESARHVLQRALPLLEKKKHVEVISKFAQMENKYGSSERAQTLYETILTSFPKRVDVWSCYVDMLVKSDSIDLARQVLERATSQNLPPKKMKTLFKKFISFEEKYGTPENVEKVRQSAVDYVESVGAATDK